MCGENDTVCFPETTASTRTVPEHCTREETTALLLRRFSLDTLERQP
jgi:hypothetical protein